MEKYSIDTEKILSKQLEKQGIELNIIPRFIKDLFYSFLDNPAINLFQVNDRLRLLGWIDINLDYHTYQLAKACFEDTNQKRPRV